MELGLFLINETPLQIRSSYHTTEKALDLTDYSPLYDINR
jgi:hypothetical protein